MVRSRSPLHNQILNHWVCVCSKPVKRGELLARIKAHLRVKSDATWVQSIVKGVLTEDSEAMKILESILPQSIISRIQVDTLNPCHP